MKTFIAHSRFFYTFEHNLNCKVADSHMVLIHVLYIRGHHGFSRGSSRAKIDMAFFSWFWLIVESRNILRLGRPLRANSSTAEVKKERMEVFACESFYLLLFACDSFYLLLHTKPTTKLKPQRALQLRRVTFQVTTFFIYSFSMHKSSKWASHHLHTTSSLVDSIFWSYYSNFS